MRPSLTRRCTFVIDDSLQNGRDGWICLCQIGVLVNHQNDPALRGLQRYVVKRLLPGAETLDELRSLAWELRQHITRKGRQCAVRILLQTHMENGGLILAELLDQPRLANPAAAIQHHQLKLRLLIAPLQLR